MKHATLCDIDDVVIEQSKVHLKHLSSSHDNEKCQVICGDGVAFLKDKEQQYDVIIIDSSDPAGPASELFGEEFYRSVHRALKPGGIACAQGECVWLHLNLIKNMLDMTRAIYANVEYAYTCIPTYPSGQIGFLLCAKDVNTKFHQPLRTPTQQQGDALQYYSSSIHRSSFVLPQFAMRKLDISLPPLSY